MCFNIKIFVEFHRYLAHALDLPRENRKFISQFGEKGSRQKDVFFDAAEKLDYHCSEKHGLFTEHTSTRVASQVNSNSQLPTERALSLQEKTHNGTMTIYTGDKAQESCFPNSINSDTAIENDSILISAKKNKQIKLAKAWANRKASHNNIQSCVCHEQNDSINQKESSYPSKLLPLTPIHKSGTTEESITGTSKDQAQPEYFNTEIINGSTSQKPQDPINTQTVTLPEQILDPSALLNLLSSSVNDSIRLSISTDSFSPGLENNRKSGSKISPHLLFSGSGGKLRVDPELGSSREFINTTANLPSSETFETSMLPSSSASSPKFSFSSKTIVSDISTNDNSSPKTRLQIKLVDGSKLLVKANHQNTVADIIKAIDDTCSDSANSKKYVLKTQYPPAVLDDTSLSLKESNLLNSVVLQHLL